MARRVRERWAGRRRVPRPRGDGPLIDKQRRDRVARSPPARGWPGFSIAIRASVTAFPARAGMARRSVLWGTSSYSVPRPRGDGPLIDVPVYRYLLRSPPARGWPVFSGSGEVAVQAFPARAGMARRAKSASATTPRVPRPRGDGPLAITRLQAPGRRSPPARGWPAGAAGDPPAADAFPARAGMARAGPYVEFLAERVPRPRGDGPKGVLKRLGMKSRSPPARGWPAGWCEPI